jgi:hypothetical protein
MNPRTGIFGILLVIALQLSAFCAENVSIIGPQTPIQPNSLATLQVKDLSDTDLQKASVTCVPLEGVTLLPAKTWGGSPFIIFSATTPGKYTITVSINAWRALLNNSILALLSRATDTEILVKLKSLITEAENSAKYPTFSSSCVVEVAGTVPPSLPPLNKVTSVTYVYEREQNKVPRSVSSALQQLNASGIVATEFDQNTVTGEGTVPKQYIIALAAAKGSGLPALVVQCGDVVKKVVKAPTTAEQVLEAVSSSTK